MYAGIAITCSIGANPPISMPISSSGLILTPSLCFPRCLTALDCSAYSAVQGSRVVFARAPAAPAALRLHLKLTSLRLHVKLSALLGSSRIGSGSCLREILVHVGRVSAI